MLLLLNVPFALTGTRFLSTSAPLLSRRANLETTLEVPQDGALWPTKNPAPGQWWITNTVSVLDPSFWEEFKKWQATLTPGRIFSVMIRPSSLEGRKVTVLHSINLTKDYPLDKIMEIIDARVAKLQESYNEEFLGYTEIKFKDIAEAKSATPVLDTQNQPSPVTDTKAAPVANVLPAYAAIAYPAPVRGTGGMDPVAQQIVSGLAPKLASIEAKLTHPTRGWEKLAETFASVIERAASPIPGIPSTTDPSSLITPILDRMEASQARIMEMMTTQRADSDARLNQLIELISLKQAPVMGETPNQSTPSGPLADKITSAIDTLAAKMANTNGRLAAQNEKTDARFEALQALQAESNSKFEAMMAQMVNLNNRFGAVEARLVALEAKVMTPSPAPSDDSGDNGSSSPAPVPTSAPSGPPATPPAGSLTSTPSSKRKKSSKSKEPSLDVTRPPYAPRPKGVDPNSYRQFESTYIRVKHRGTKEELALLDDQMDARTPSGQLTTVES